MPPRTTRKSTRGHEPQIEPWLTPYNHSACPVSETARRCRNQEDEPADMEQRKPNPRARHQRSDFYGERGWMSQKISAPPVQGEKSSLTSPFIEQAFTASRLFSGLQDLRGLPSRWKQPEEPKVVG